MALVVAVGSDRGVLLRWSDMTQAAGHECVILPPASLIEKPQIGAAVCLYDMGAAGGSDPQPLFDAIQACPDTRFVAMSANPQAQEGLKLLRGGARGYCNRLLSSQALAILIPTLENGEIWAGKQVTQYLLENALAEPATPSMPQESLFGHLTARETGIAQQVGAGHSNKVIAADSGISERTVKAHLNSIFRKTGIRNRVQLALAVSQTNPGPRRRSNG